MCNTFLCFCTHSLFVHALSVCACTLFAHTLSVFTWTLCLLQHAHLTSVCGCSAHSVCNTLCHLHSLCLQHTCTLCMLCTLCHASMLYMPELEWGTIYFCWCIWCIHEYLSICVTVFKDLTLVQLVNLNPTMWRFLVLTASSI